MAGSKLAQKDSGNIDNTDKKLSGDISLTILQKGKVPPLDRYTEKCFDDNENLNHVKSDPVDSNYVRIDNEENHCIVHRPLSPSFSSYKRWSRIDVHFDLNNLALVNADTNSISNSTSISLEGEDDEGGEEEEYHRKGGPFEPAGQHLMMDIQHGGSTVFARHETIGPSHGTIDYAIEIDPLVLPLSCFATTQHVGCLVHWRDVGIARVVAHMAKGRHSHHEYVPYRTHATTPTHTMQDHTVSWLVPPTVWWTYKKRVYRDSFHAQNATLVASAKEARLLRLHAQQGGDSDDAERYFLGRSDNKTKPILSTDTDFQQVDVYISYLPTPLLNDEIHIKQQQPPVTVEPINKRVFLDGALQSTLHGMEALVHPAMTMAEAVDQVRRVAIIGGGEGATLREVLEYKFVETCVMIEIYQEFVNLARKYLPEWNDCRDLTIMLQNQHKTAVNGKSTNEYVSCFDDPRADLYFDDAFVRMHYYEAFGSRPSEASVAQATPIKGSRNRSPPTVGTIPKNIRSPTNIIVLTSTPIRTDAFAKPKQTNNNSAFTN
ncbi:hypothetical protein ACA910_001503 [Epithemia clementina (nom. ined.)]